MFIFFKRRGWVLGFFGRFELVLGILYVVGSLVKYGNVEEM